VGGNLFVRKPIIAGNWKMHGSQGQAQALSTTIKNGIGSYAITMDVILFPTFLYLASVQALLAPTAIMIGAQNLYIEAEGAFTGEVSGPMLVDVGCRYVLVGHSERRTIFQESLALVAAKFRAALIAGLQPILCVGETRIQREKGEAQQVIREQICTVMEKVDAMMLQRAVVAYEPVWAIGTGLTATPEQAQEMHAFIRELIARNDLDVAKTIRILYGGSVKADNAASLFAMPDIDGGLVGGASLDAGSFLEICAIANMRQEG
jgi:triosephosphate isomerase